MTETEQLASALAAIARYDALLTKAEAMIARLIAQLQAIQGVRQ